MENVRKHRDIKLVTTDEKRNKLVSEPNYHTTKRFSEKLLTIEMKTIKVKMNKPVYLGISVVDISKTLWYDYIKPKFGDRAKLCYTDTYSFIIHILTKGFFKDIADDVKKWVHTYSYDENEKRTLAIGKNKKALGFLKDELRGKIIKEICAIGLKL